MSGVGPTNAGDAPRRGAAARRCAACILFAALALPGAARAQEDFRNVDPDRPIRVEDAYPIEYREWELELGARPAFREGGPSHLAGHLELKAGLYYGLQAGAALETALRSGGGLESEFGVEEMGVHILYNFNPESRSMPGLGVRADVLAPTGGALGRDEVGFAFTGLATRSFGRLRLHGNLGYRVNGEDERAGPLRSQDVWFGGVAFDFPVGLFSRLVLGDVFVDLPVDRGAARVVAEVGTRLQVRNTWVLDLGIASELSTLDEALNGQLVVGLSHTFGIPWLVPVPQYPDPTIDR